MKPKEAIHLDSVGKKWQQVTAAQKRRLLFSGVFCVSTDKITARMIKKYAGSWAGDDLDECLEMVQKTIF